MKFDIENFSSVLIANRGEIACRIVKTAKKCGLKTIVVYTHADRDSPHVKLADKAILIGDGPVRESYLSIPKIINAALSSKAEAIHPGYGFLSENADFAIACEKNGLIFHENEFDDLVEQSAPIIMHFKNMFNRKRPNEIDNKINTLPSKTNKTRSYPSGHSTQARLVARYVAGKFPEHEIELLKKGNECGMGRVRAGFHYPTDNETGILLGEKLYVFLNKDNYEN